MVADAPLLLALGVRRGRIAALLLAGETIEGWVSSNWGGRSPDNAAVKLKDWIATYTPDIVVSENPDTTSKGARHTALLQSLARAGEDADVLNLLVVRERSYTNLYEEAEALVARFPALEPKRAKKPRIWEGEVRSLIYFEALALALQVIDQKA